ncbi:putative ABC transporter permease [Coprococcus sp. AF21-14LB]|uniref:putative ABC transporter permease n=1 Tax=Coprococcus sp. AF21-14LB TaxID=2292231 RepID=UPI001FA8F4B8
MYHYLLNFFIYGFLGWCTEVAFAAFKEHHFVNRGFLNGPICPIYGFGVSTVILFLTPFQITCFFSILFQQLSLLLWNG